MTTPPRKPANTTRAIGAGLTLAVSVGLLAYGGLWLDGNLDTKPLFLLIGVAWGVIGGTIHLVRVISPELLPWGRKRKNGEGNGPPR